MTPIMSMRIWGVAALAAGIVVFVLGVWYIWRTSLGANWEFEGLIGVFVLFVGIFLGAGVVLGPALVASGLLLLYRSVRTKERAAVTP